MWRGKSKNAESPAAAGRLCYDAFDTVQAEFNDLVSAEISTSEDLRQVPIPYVAVTFEITGVSNLKTIDKLYHRFPI